ncbi:MAG TPA: hypothetical protein IAA98_01070 [Candidatus Avipropionibacterium avicola]|uniref:PH domain-containing protein n=1 Tax=Candidatus Avipropionibacterium avicola TaxID=2840701 RepID=A0A9D1KL23_9ACTN|nr:hypothetical protein [Candidatus Avipropionibacterium avicola]
MTDMADDLDEWVRAVTRALQLDPAEVPVDLLLDLTRDAAHGVMRPAGPLTTFMVGLAVARGASVDDAVATVRSEIDQW